MVFAASAARVPRAEARVLFDIVNS